MVAALTQRDFQSKGPGEFSSSYLRNSVLPNLHGQVQFSSDGHVVGIGFDYKQLTPRLVTTKNVSTEESISGLCSHSNF